MKKLTIVAALAMLAAAGLARAADYPTRPVTMIVPFAAGGPQDQIGRVIAQKLGEVLGQQVVVENVGGAGGMTGSARVMQSPPDGYTMVLGSVGTHAQNQTLYKHPLYNAATDFTPVALIAEVPIALIARKTLPASNLKEFVAYAKENQAKMQFGSAGAGSATHLGCVVLNSAIGVTITHVPYRGAGPAMQDLIGGRIDYLCDLMNTAKAQIDAGTVKPIAIMTKDRSPALPNLPTTAEQGWPDVQAYSWSAIFLPKGAPDALVNTLNAAIVKAMYSEDVQKALATGGVQVVSKDRSTPAYLAQFVKDEIKKWEGPIKASGASAD